MRKMSKKTLALVVSLALLIFAGAGTTLAYLLDVTGPVVNLFQPSQVTTKVLEDPFTGGVKTKVQIQNTGDVNAYIRAAVVINWQDEGGNIYGKAPVPVTDYTISYNEAVQPDYNNGEWVYNTNDGFWYWTKPVAPGATTGILITECVDKDTAIAENGVTYDLAVEIIGSGVQSDGVKTGGTKAVEDAWDVDPSTLTNVQPNG